MQLRNTLLVGLITLTLAGCSVFSGESDVVTASPVPEIENQFIPTQNWSTSVGDGIGSYYSHLRPAAQDGVVYAADRHGTVKALSLFDGKQQWKASLAEKTGFLSRNRSALLSGGLTVSGTHIYVGSERAIVYALNREDGQLAWQTRVAGEAISRPVVVDGMVLIHTTNGQLQALNETDGAIRWTASLDVPSLSLRGESAPATAFGAAIVGGDNGRVSAVLLQQGQLIWQQRISQPGGVSEISRLNDVDTTPVVVGNVVYALGYNGNLAALDLRSGQVIWKRDVGSVSDFIVDAGRIYLVDQNDRILVTGTEGGSTIWSQDDLLHRGLTPPALYQGYLVVGDAEGYLHWLDVTDGRFVSQQHVDSKGFLSAPIVAGDTLLIQARGGKVHAFTR
ncbi:outer membrane protein assembly factor BamB [Serratia microhaemolytica]|uniref:outer membrane protein assembly factor BamB n=1 Tax=Serratia microhaemolytica TaxID=2675110 RepID=UPI000FDEDA2F|nr:outer membrane protein assembly factor BamB [Serratia microhaemolytica]